MRGFMRLWTKKTWIGLGLGQILSLLITSTGFSSSELAKQGSFFLFISSVFNQHHVLFGIVISFNNNWKVRIRLQLLKIKIMLILLFQITVWIFMIDDLLLDNLLLYVIFLQYT